MGASPTSAPTAGPTASPTASPTSAPTAAPTDSPTSNQTASPTTLSPTASPTSAPTAGPTASPTASPTSAPTAAPTDSPTSNPTASPTTLSPTASVKNTPTAAPLPEACVNNVAFNCSKHSVGFTKKKCFRRIQKKWGVGKRFKDVCPEMCKPHLCTCVDRVGKFSIKHEDGERTCKDLIGMEPPDLKSICKKRTDIGFTVKSICPNQCGNTGNCVTESP